MRLCPFPCPCLSRVYAPGEFKVLTGDEGGNFREATGWRSASRPEASYEEAVVFDAPREAKTVTLIMRSPMPWGYFGLGGASVMAAAPSEVMLVAAAGDGGEDLCLAAAGDRVHTLPCLDVIASGTGGEVFSFNSFSQLVSAVDGRCVGVAHGLTFSGNALVLTACGGSNTQRATFELAPTGHLRLTSAGDYCVVASPSADATVQDCGDSTPGSHFVLAPVKQGAAQAARVLHDAAVMLDAATGRQEQLLEKLRVTMRSSGPCRLSMPGAGGPLRGNASMASSWVQTQAGLWQGDGPAAACAQKIDATLRPGLDRAKQVIAASVAALKAL